MWKRKAKSPQRASTYKRALTAFVVESEGIHRSSVVSVVPFLSRIIFFGPGVVRACVVRTFCVLHETLKNGQRLVFLLSIGRLRSISTSVDRRLRPPVDPNGNYVAGRTISIALIAYARSSRRPSAWLPGATRQKQASSPTSPLRRSGLAALTFDARPRGRMLPD